MMKKYAVIGWPLHHSISPDIHNPALEACAVDGMYEKIELPPDNFKERIAMVKSVYTGFNITIPYKEQIIKYLDKIDREAASVGAVNTAALQNGVWVGYNTDIAGFIKPLLNIKKNFSSVLLLGSGGASRAVIYAIVNHLKPKRIWLAARTRKKAQVLTDEFKPLLDRRHCTLTICGFSDAVHYCPESSLIVNCTPIGTTPAIDKTPLPNLHTLMDAAVVYDIVYNPQETRLLKEAKVAGRDIITINGLEMLIEQAAEAFTIWTGHNFPYTVTRAHLQNVLK